MRLCAFAIALAAAPCSSMAVPLGPQSTGNVEADFPSGAAGVTTLINPQFTMADPASYIAQHNMSPGWEIKDIRLYYDKASDTMDVGVNFFGIAGDADGNGDPGSSSAGNGYVDVAHLGGRESITIGFDFQHTGSPQVLAGVPSEKSMAGPGLDGFNVALNADNGLGLANSYGQTLANNLGNLVFDPSAQHPGFEFTIKNFSQLPGYNPSRSYSLMAFAGSPDDGVEEEGVLFPQVSGETIGPQVPDPTTWLAWSLGIAGASAFGRLRRRRDQGGATR
jgi:hypothetical protein